MPSLLVLVESAVIGIAFFAAINHSIIALVKTQRKLHLLFVVLALAICGVELANLFGHSAESRAEIVSINRWRVFFALVFIGIFPWFITTISGLRPLKTLSAFSIAILAFIIFHFSLPYGIGFSRLPEIGYRQLPWGDTVSWATRDMAWPYLLFAFLFLALAYAFLAGIQQLRGKPKSPAVTLLAANSLFLLAVIVDFLVNMGKLEFIYVSGWGFLAFIITMSVYETDRLLRSYRQERSLKKQLHDIVDHADAVVYLKDRNGVYRLVNHRFSEVTGISEDLVVGRTAFDIFPRDYAERLRENDAQVLSAGLTLEFEETVVLADREHVYRSVKFPLKDTRNEVVGLCGIDTDLTEYKQLQSELSRREEMVKSYSTELEAFSTSVAHDLRTPLNAIHGYSHLLLMRFRSRLDEDGQQFLQSIIESSSQMGQMLNALTSMANISRTELKTETVDLTALARGVVKHLQNIDPQRRVVVIVQEGLTVQARADLLEVMLTNLLGNAWKFTGQTPDARIEMGSMEKDGHRTFFVKDNGPGFDMDQRDKLFLPFQRLHSDDEFAGTGVGLSIVRRVIEHHDGQIWAESAPGQGATFYFQL